MNVASFTIPDHAGFDMARGAAAVIGAVLFLTCLAILLTLWRRSGAELVPPWVRLALAAWMIGDAYVAAREAFEIGRPVYILGLPLAAAWELFALAYLYQLWRATGGLRHRQNW